MKKIYIFVVSILFVSLITGCYTDKNNDEKEIKFYCNGLLDAIDYFYEDDEYIYSYGVQGNYIMYGDEKYSFKEALEKNIITINDIDEEIKTQKNCEYGKEKK